MLDWSSSESIDCLLRITSLRVGKMKRDTFI